MLSLSFACVIYPKVSGTSLVYIRGLNPKTSPQSAALLLPLRPTCLFLISPLSSMCSAHVIDSASLRQISHRGP
jgi:hypothetical protein